jgi:hypothetical protein
VEKVRDEIFQMLKGMLCATICPAISLFLAQESNPSGLKISQAFCGWGEMSLSRHLATFFLVWIASDFYEFSYHRLGLANLLYINLCFTLELSQQLLVNNYDLSFELSVSVY